MDLSTTAHKRLPSWLRRELPKHSTIKTNAILGEFGLNTVCESALCPNRTECYSRSTATFMILGNTCTRSCGFCNIEAGKGEQVMTDEPDRVALAAKGLGLKYIVITSVARDDLQDEGAEHFHQTITAVKRELPGSQIEVLTPDFHARPELIARIVEAGPQVYNHNLETVRRLQKEVRVQATFERSLKVLSLVKEMDPAIRTKSGLMLGLGEKEDEIFDAARALRDIDCNILTLGQYLPPSKEHLPVEEYVEPEYFNYLAVELEKLGFDNVFAGPYIRSSYHAGEVFYDAEKKTGE